MNVAELVKRLEEEQMVSEETLVGDLSGIDVSGKVFNKVDFTQAEIGSCNLSGATLIECPLTGLNFTLASMNRLVLKDCDARSGNFSSTNLGNVTATKTDFSGASFDKTRFIQSTFINC